MLVPKCPGAKLSIFLLWCQIVHLPSWCQIFRFYYLGAKLYGAKLSYHPVQQDIWVDRKTFHVLGWGRFIHVPNSQLGRQNSFGNSCTYLCIVCFCIRPSSQLYRQNFLVIFVFSYLFFSILLGRQNSLVILNFAGMKYMHGKKNIRDFISNSGGGATRRIRKYTVTDFFIFIDLQKNMISCALDDQYSYYIISILISLVFLYHIYIFLILKIIFIIG